MNDKLFLSLWIIIYYENNKLTQKKTVTKLFGTYNKNKTKIKHEKPIKILFDKNCKFYFNAKTIFPCKDFLFSHSFPKDIKIN